MRSYKVAAERRYETDLYLLRLSQHIEAMFIMLFTFIRLAIRWPYSGGDREPPRVMPDFCCSMLDSWKMRAEQWNSFAPICKMRSRLSSLIPPPKRNTRKICQPGFISWCCCIFHLLLLVTKNVATVVVIIGHACINL